MKYQVAEYTIDTARYRISSGDAAIPAEPKVFDLLVYLIRHRDRVLSREELFREVWDGREVSDATLSNHVKSARKILGDSGELQKTILTIRGRGYQFIAPVTVIAGGRSGCRSRQGTGAGARDGSRRSSCCAGLALAAVDRRHAAAGCAARLVRLRFVPDATGLRRALRRRGALRCVRRCARSLATFRGSGHAGSHPQPEEDIRV